MFGVWVARIYSEPERTMMRAFVKTRASSKTPLSVAPGAVAHGLSSIKDTPKAEDVRGRDTRNRRRSPIMWHPESEQDTQTVAHVEMSVAHGARHSSVIEMGVKKVEGFLESEEPLSRGKEWFGVRNGSLPSDPVIILERSASLSFGFHPSSPVGPD